MRRAQTVLILGIVVSAFLAQDAAAQWNVARFGAEPDRVYATFGLDPALVTSVGYGHTASVRGHAFQVTGDLGIVTARLDARDFRARFGVHTSVARWRSLRLTGSATAITRGTDNVIYRGYNFGADVTGTLGVYRPRWFAAGEFGKDKAVITHVVHTDWYRDHFYPDAKDGWYLDAGGTFHYGLAAGVTLGRAEVVSRFGFLRTEDFNAMIPPMYGSVGLGFAF
jgi:hypothetical protein